jgi:TolA-binding protein
LKTMKSVPIYFICGIILLVLMTNVSCFAAPKNLYTVHCASYKVQQQAAADVKNLAAMGYAAFLVPVDIKNKGKWYRVYAGKYDSKEKARVAAEEMIKKKVISEYFIFPISADLARQNKGKNINRENSSSSVPAEKKIIVIANSDSKRYHLPGMPFYNNVKKHHRVLFNSEEEAIKAGYYKAGGSSNQQLQVKQAEPAIDKRKAKSSPVEIKQEKQPSPVIEKQDGVIAKTKTAEKVQQIPRALTLKKESDKAIKTELLPAEKEEINSGSVLYDKALDELKKKDYEKALIIFKEFVARDDTSNELGERALRHIADCHFFLGEKGSKEHLAIAVQLYKNTLQSFPDEKRENALTYFRLAKTYEYLKNYADALRNYESLLTKYPNSAYIPDASYKIGALLHSTGKYNQAADKLIAYLIKYRGGSFAKQAFYLVADCHYKMQQSASAEIWFRDAQKKWSDLTNVPKEVVIDMGQHKFSLHRYDEAINIFSSYVNLYPDDEKTKEILLLLANSYKAAAQVSAALTIYNLIIDKYPESKETQESIMAMASLGIDKPGIKVFSALRNIHYYKEPLEAYNIVLMKNQSKEIAQIALLQKGDALHKLKRDRKAADVYLEFLNLYPQSKLINEARRGLKIASVTLIDEYYQKKDYLAVADIYFKAYRAVPLQADEYEIVNKIAISLKDNGLMDDYVKILKDYKNVCKDDKIAVTVMFNIAEGEMARNNYDEAEKIFGELLDQPAVKKTTLMVAIRKDLAEIAYRKGLYDKAIADFDAVVKSGQNIKDPGLTFWHYAASLKEKNENARSLQNYLKAVEYLNQDKSPAIGFGEAYKATGDLYFQENNFKNSLDMYNKVLVRSPNPDLKSWSLFNAGRSHLKMDNNAEAQKTFTKIKTESGPEGFWTKVVDYYVDDQKWWGKYGEYLKR